MPGTFGHVVAAGYAENVVGRFFDGYIVGFLPDDDDDFGFGGRVFRIGGQDDGFALGDDARGKLGE